MAALIVLLKTMGYATIRFEILEKHIYTITRAGEIHGAIKHNADERLNIQRQPERYSMHPAVGANWQSRGA